jgi:hypothetical protein
MKRIYLLKWILIVFAITKLQGLFAQDFNIYNSWNFENEELGQYTDAEVSEDFTSTILYSHNSASIANDVINGSSTKIMRITHEANKVSVGFELNVNLKKDYDEVYLSFNWKFSNEFNSTAGGKLPGLGGLPDFGAYCPTGVNGFRVHNMFYQAGQIFSYHYDRSSYGESYGCPWGGPAGASDYFSYNYMNNGTWYNITQRLVMNTFTGGVANQDGIKEVWIDGRLVMQEKDLKFMGVQSDTLKIDAFRLSNFYGGDGDVYKPLHECYGYIDNIKVYMPNNDPITGHNLHSSSTIISTPDKINDRRVYFDQLITSQGILHNNDYGNNYSPCVDEAYLIDAGAGNTVTYTYNYSLGANDYLLFYDGNASDSKRLQAIAGTSNASNQTIKSTGRYLFVRFSTDTQGQASGWTGNISFEYDDDYVENNPPVIENQPFTIDQNTYSSNIIGTVVATENDPGQSLSYTITSGNESGLFNLNSQSGVLTLIDENIFNLEPEEYVLRVRATDNGEGNLSDEANITISVIKQEAPIVIIYIDPENKNDEHEDGTIQHPYDSWKDVNWTSGISYLQKRGTIANEAKITVLANYIVIGAYGEGDQPVIWSSAEDYAMSFFEKSHLTIQNINIVAENAMSSLYFLGDNMDSVTIENSKFEGSVYGIRVLGGKNFAIRYNTFRGNSNSIYSYAEHTRIFYDIFQNNQMAVQIDGENSTAEIYNNVFYDNNRAVVTEFSELTLYNNIFYLTKNMDIAVDYNGTKLISDFNIYYPNQEDFFSLNGEMYSDLTQLQQLQSIDASSFVSDPLFVDAFNHNFAVETTSPAIDAGRFVGLTSDLIGESVPYGNNPDIGAIEVNNHTSSIITRDKTENLMRVYPNPTKGTFSISFSKDQLKQQEAELNIIDIQGNSILEKRYEDLNESTNETFNISNFPAGIYIVSMQIANAIYSQRIVKIF